MRFLLGFLFAFFIMSISPTTIAYMIQYLNSLHHVVQDRVIEGLEKMPAPQAPTPNKPSRWETT
jgi:hypothetical protein